MNPPFDVAALTKQITKITIDDNTSHHPLTSTGVRIGSKNAYTNRWPFRADRPAPSCVDAIIATPTPRDRK